MNWLISQNTHLGGQIMAYRKIHDSFWTDPDMEELTPEQKYFYLYLMTNPRVNQIGLYEFSIKHAALETGYNIDTVSKLLDSFKELGKIRVSESSREILVVKFWFHNKSESPKMQSHVNQLLTLVKDTALIPYIYSMHTTPQEEEEEEKEKEKNKEYKTFVEKYFDWFKKMNDGVIPKMSAIEGKNLNQIIRYLKQIHASELKNGRELPGESESVINMWCYILGNWGRLDAFYQKGTRLRDINSNIQNIITSLKNGKSARSKQGTTPDDINRIVEGIFSK